jgi:mannose-6-phosphate isomerase
VKFLAHRVEKPWGRIQVPPIFGDTGGRRIGEIWFEPPASTELPLLIKYIFTSEKLSIQVHPDDEQARQRGFPLGKSECWYILDAEPNATIGLGLQRPVSPEQLRHAALDGSIERLMNWKTVSPGDFFLVPPGTVHAIGAGIALLEFQQNADVTYRLYDYGRPRDLHIEEATAVSTPAPYQGECLRSSAVPPDTILLRGPKFSLVRASSIDGVATCLSDRRRWVAPLEGSAASGDDHACAGECLLLEPHASLSIGDSSLVLIGAEGTL